MIGGRAGRRRCRRDGEPLRSPTVRPSSPTACRSAFVRQLSPPVIDWVSRNKDALLAFWYHGDTWTEPEVNNFIQNFSGVDGLFPLWVLNGGRVVGEIFLARIAGPYPH
jgi:hypothetical protein